MAQDVTGTRNIFWYGPPGRGVANAGPFVAYSHFGQYMCLSIGAGLGLLMVVLSQAPRRGSSDSFPLRLLTDARLRSACLIGLFITMAVITIFLCGSRGAMLGLILALGAGMAVLSRTRGLERPGLACRAGGLDCLRGGLVLRPIDYSSIASSRCNNPKPSPTAGKSLKTSLPSGSNSPSPEPAWAATR